MKDWVTLVLVAGAVFAGIAGAGFLVFPPDVFVTAPLIIAALVLCWPIAYWIVSYREGTTLFDTGP